MNRLQQRPTVTQPIPPRGNPPQPPRSTPPEIAPVASNAPEITYRGTINTFGACTFRVIMICHIDGRGVEHDESLKPRLDISNWRSGLDWGDNSGASYAAALALLAHATGRDEVALRWFKLFGKCVIAKLPQGEWKMTRHEVLRKLSELQRWANGNAKRGRR